jgi:integrase
LVVDSSCRLNHAVAVFRHVPAAVKVLQLRLRLVKRGASSANQCKMAKLALLTLCMSPVIVVGAISDPPHMLRHATGYKLANDGQDTRAIQQYLGHRNIQHTTRYTDLAPNRFKDFWRD